MTNWTSGATEPRASDIARMCDALGVSADYLIGRVDLECGLVPGTWIVDLDEHERPSGNGEISVEVPRRPAIVTRKQADEMHAEADRRLNAKLQDEGRNED